MRLNCQGEVLVNSWGQTLTVSHTSPFVDTEKIGGYTQLWSKVRPMDVESDWRGPLNNLQEGLRIIARSRKQNKTNCRYWEDWRIQSVVVGICWWSQRKTICCADFNKVVCFLPAAVRKSPQSTGFTWVIQNKICKLMHSLSESLNYRNHGVVIWEKDDPRGAAEEEPESPE